MNRTLKHCFTTAVAGTVVFVSLMIISHANKMLKDYDRESENFRAELDAQRKADEAVRKLIKSGHYDNMTDANARYKALAEDYAFFKMAAKIED